MGLGPTPSCVLRALRGFVLHLIQISRAPRPSRRAAPHGDRADPLPPAANFLPLQEVTRAGPWTAATVTAPASTPVPNRASRSGDGQSPTAYVLSLNLHRRHLIEDQRAAIAVEAKERFEEEARITAPPRERNRRERSDAGMGHRPGRRRGRVDDAAATGAVVVVRGPVAHGAGAAVIEETRPTLEPSVANDPTRGGRSLPESSAGGRGPNTPSTAPTSTASWRWTTAARRRPLSPPERSNERSTSMPQGHR